MYVFERKLLTSTKLRVFDVEDLVFEKNLIWGQLLIKFHVCSTSRTNSKGTVREEAFAFPFAFSPFWEP